MTMTADELVEVARETLLSWEFQPKTELALHEENIRKHILYEFVSNLLESGKFEGDQSKALDAAADCLVESKPRHALRDELALALKYCNRDEALKAGGILANLLRNNKE